MRTAVVAVLVVTAACDAETPSFSERTVRVEMQYVEGELDVTATMELAPYQPIDDPRLAASVTVHGQKIGLGKYLPDSPYVGRAALDAPLASDDEIIITFNQRDGEYDQLTVTAPPPLTLTPPTEARIGAPVTVTWMPMSNDAMRWRGDGCDVSFINGPIPNDTGSLTFPPGVLAQVYPCGVDLAFDRWRTSLPESAFRSALVTVTQTATVFVDVKGQQ
jgi:hypothetical protein